MASLTATGRRGFTLIELLVVMSIIALLLTIAVPRYFKSVERSKETVLRQDLGTMRDAIDKFYADNGRYPDAIAELVDKHYLRNLPLDPITDSTDTWLTVPPPDATEPGNIYDIKSGAAGTASDGSLFADW